MTEVYNFVMSRVSTLGIPLVSSMSVHKVIAAQDNTQMILQT
jgi:hypothetical protein